MSKPSSPCKGCELRYIGCHSECLNYIDFVQRNEAQRESAHKVREVGNSLLIMNTHRKSERKRKKG